LPNLPVVSGKQVIKALERLGFVQKRQRGDHVVMRKETPEGAKGTTVLLHKEVKRDTLDSILKQAGVSRQDFIDKL
jgi:predicted RNA binding protein YcfA (HicA-like mRNA interferase family)